MWRARKAYRERIQFFKDNVSYDLSIPRLDEVVEHMYNYHHIRFSGIPYYCAHAHMGMLSIYLVNFLHSPCAHVQFIYINYVHVCKVPTWCNVCIGALVDTLCKKFIRIK